MTTIFVILLFVFVALLIIVMFLFLKKMVIKINQQSKDYFVDKLQIYDDLINEKEKKLKGLNEKIESKQRKIEMQDAEAEESSPVYLYDMKNIDYQDEEIFQKMKDVEKKFNIDNASLIQEFVKEHFQEDSVSYYQQLVECRNSFDQEIIYQLVLKSSTEQERIVKDLLKENTQVLDDFKKKNKKKFHVLKFISYFDKVIDSVDPYIYVYVGTPLENFDSLHPFIKTKVDDTIYKGICIIYKGKLYDYSLK